MTPDFTDEVKYQVGSFVQVSWEKHGIPDNQLQCNKAVIIGIYAKFWHSPDVRTIRYEVAFELEPLKVEFRIFGGIGKITCIYDRHIVKLIN